LSFISFWKRKDIQQLIAHANAGTNEDGIVMKEAAFRGRKLMGSTLLLPDGCCGNLLFSSTRFECYFPPRLELVFVDLGDLALFFFLSVHKVTTHNSFTDLSY